MCINPEQGRMRVKSEQVGISGDSIIFTDAATTCYRCTKTRNRIVTAGWTLFMYKKYIHARMCKNPEH